MSFMGHFEIISGVIFRISCQFLFMFRISNHFSDFGSFSGHFSGSRVTFRISGHFRIIFGSIFRASGHFRVIWVIFGSFSGHFRVIRNISGHFRVTPANHCNHYEATGSPCFNFRILHLVLVAPFQNLDFQPRLHHVS